MADPKRYKATDPDSGRTVTFDWRGDVPPTDDDIAEVFAAAVPPKDEPLLTRERRPAGEQSATDRMAAETAAVNHPHARVGRAVVRGVKAIGDPENLPAVGGALGGIAAAPFTAGMSIPAGLALTAGGAAVGGALGAGGRRMHQEAEGTAGPATAGELAGEMTREGAIQGGTQLAGGVLAKAGGAVLRPVGRLAYRLAINPSKALMKEFPDIVETGIREGANVSKAGLAQATAARGASSAEADAMVAAADDTTPITWDEIRRTAFGPTLQAERAKATIGKVPDIGRVKERAAAVKASFGGKPTVPDRIVVRGIRAAPAPGGDEAIERAMSAEQLRAPSAMRAPGAAAELRAAQELGPGAAAIPRSVLRGKVEPVKPPTEFVTPGRTAEPGGITKIQGHARKKVAQDAASAAYKKAGAGQTIDDMEALTDKNLASAYQRAVEKRVPGVADVNQRTRSLIGLTDALDDATSRQIVLRYLLAAPTGGTSLLTAPPVAGQLGIMMGRAGGGQGRIPANAARILRQALLDQMQGAGQEPQP